ncbi:hypothetical protein B0H21DRAFT_690642 [Amylocystis lapponica]|nr:hypothetical protein B0H21DRAFT_690642 [Amylocystis lapponica]
MSSSESSSSPEPEIIPKKSKKKSKEKGKKKSTVDTQAKNEGTNPDWAYKPPEGTALLDHGVDTAEFDWDAVKEDDNLEMWIVRVPEGIKSKHLQNLKVDAPSSSKTSRIGSIDKKHASYDVWSLGEEQGVVGGEEIKGLSCLLPRLCKGGKLYQAPKPVARHIVVSARPALPTPEPSSEPSASGSSPPVYKNPPRPRHPTELLKHRFMPMGALAPVEGAAHSPDSMDLDQVEQLIGDTQDEDESPIKISQKSTPSFGENKAIGHAKKRKGDGDGMKKAKKSKTAAS